MLAELVIGEPLFPGNKDDMQAVLVWTNFKRFYSLLVFLRIKLFRSWELNLGLLSPLN